MTHGSVPTVRCGATRAVFITMQELGRAATAKEIHGLAMALASKPRTLDYIERRVLERGTTDGWIDRVEGNKYRLKPGTARVEAWIHKQTAEDA